MQCCHFTRATARTEAIFASYSNPGFKAHRLYRSRGSHLQSDSCQRSPRLWHGASRLAKSRDGKRRLKTFASIERSSENALHQPSKDVSPFRTVCFHVRTFPCRCITNTVCYHVRPAPIQKIKVLVKGYCPPFSISTMSRIRQFLPISEVSAACSQLYTGNNMSFSAVSGLALPQCTVSHLPSWLCLSR